MEPEALRQIEAWVAQVEELGFAKESETLKDFKALLKYCAELKAENERLKEYEWMYKDLCE